MFAHVRRSGRCRQTSPMTGIATACWPRTSPTSSSCCSCSSFWPLHLAESGLTSTQNLSLTSVVCLSETNGQYGQTSSRSRSRTMSGLSLAAGPSSWPSWPSRPSGGVFGGFNNQTNRATNQPTGGQWGLVRWRQVQQLGQGQGESLLKIMLNGSKTMCVCFNTSSQFCWPVWSPCFRVAAAPDLMRINAKVEIPKSEIRVEPADIPPHCNSLTPINKM